jgi:hypothetical protein
VRHQFRCPAIALGALVALTLASATGVASSQNEQATVTISGPTRIADSAKSVEINVTVDNASNLAGFQFVLTVDSNMLHPVSADHTTFLTDGGREIICPDPTVDAASLLFRCVTLRTTPPGVDGSGTLAVVTLAPSGKGTSSIGLSHVKLVHPDGSELPSRAIDGQLTVSGGAGGGGWFTWPRAALVAGIAVILLLATAFIWRRRSHRAVDTGAGDLGGDVI